MFKQWAHQTFVVAGFEIRKFLAGRKWFFPLLLAAAPVSLSSWVPMSWPAARLPFARCDRAATSEWLLATPTSILSNPYLQETHDFNGIADSPVR